MIAGPSSTYRLQVHQDFDLFDVADIAEYVRRLGADWLYLSPLLHAEVGSDHGYDVVEHDHVDQARGGAAGLAALDAATRRIGAGVLVDIVPNHVSVADATANAWWCDVLTRGQASPYAEAFDICPRPACTGKNGWVGAVGGRSLFRVGTRYLVYCVRFICCNGLVVGASWLVRGCDGWNSTGPWCRLVGLGEALGEPGFEGGDGVLGAGGVGGGEGADEPVSAAG